MLTRLRGYQGKKPILEEGVYVDPSALVIGDVTLGKDVSVWPMAVVRGDVNSIQIGAACNIQDGSILHVTHDGPYTKGGTPLILGQGITVGHKVVLHACSIADYCLIGIGSIILDQVEVDHHVMIGANSLVPPGKKLESGYLYLGNPARAVRKLTAIEWEKLEYSAAHYVALKDKYLG